MGILRQETDPQARFTTKSDRLTYQELDGNFIDILDRIDGLVDGAVNRIQLSDGSNGFASVNDFVFDPATSTLVINDTSGTANASLIIKGQNTGTNTVNTIIKDSSNNNIIRFTDAGSIIAGLPTGTVQVGVVSLTSTIVSPTTGMIVYNTTSGVFEGYNGTEWGAISGGDGGATVTGTTGAIIYTDGFGTALSDGANFNWDDTDNRLSIGTSFIDTNTGSTTLATPGVRFGNATNSRALVQFGSTSWIYANHTGTNVGFGLVSSNGMFYLNNNSTIGGNAELKFSSTGTISNLRTVNTHPSLGLDINLIGNEFSDGLTVKADTKTLLYIPNNGDGTSGSTDLTARFTNLNLGIGGTVPTSSMNVLGVHIGTAPTSNQADAFQLYASDYSTAGTASPFIRTEDGVILNLRDAATKEITLDFFASIETVKIVSLDRITNNATISDITFDPLEIDQLTFRTRVAGTSAWDVRADLAAVQSFITSSVTNGQKYYVEITAIFDVGWSQEAQINILYTK